MYSKHCYGFKRGPLCKSWLKDKSTGANQSNVRKFDLSAPPLSMNKKSQPTGRNSHQPDIELMTLGSAN